MKIRLMPACSHKACLIMLASSLPVLLIRCSAFMLSLHDIGIVQYIYYERGNIMTVINNQMAFSAVIESERVKAGLTQEELANNAGISIRNLKMIENGEANPSLETMLALCEALKVAMNVNRNDSQNANMLTFSDSMNPSEYGIMHYIQRSTDMLNKSILPFTVVTGSNRTNGSYLNHIITALHDNDDYNVITIGNHDMINDIIDMKLDLNSVVYLTNHYVMGSDNKPLQYVFNTDEFMNLIKDTMSDDELAYLHMNDIKLVLDSINDGSFTYDDLNKYQSDDAVLNDASEFIRVVLHQKLLSGLYKADSIYSVLDYDSTINDIRIRNNIPMNETIIPFALSGSYGKYDKKRYMITSCNEFIRIFKHITSNESMESEHPVIDPAKTNILIINAPTDVMKMQSFQSYLLNALKLCRSYRIIPILNAGNDASILSNSKIKARTTDIVFTHDDYINNAIHNYKNISGVKSMEMAGFLTRMPLDEYVHYDMIANKLEPFILNDK